MDYPHIDWLDIDWLKKNHLLIHYFGLGFIQLKINQYHRMHFYTKELPAIVPEEDIHNHRYNFTSHVVKGYLSQEIYQIVDGDCYLREKESCKAGVEVQEEGVPCGIKLLGTQMFAVGSHYWMWHDTFHKVKSDNCITLLTRTDYMKDLAEVVRMVGEAKVCPFSQSVEKDRLWQVVEDMLKN